MRNEKVIIFGAGQKGRYALNTILSNCGDIVEAVIDNHNNGFSLKEVPVLYAVEFLQNSNINEYAYIVCGKFCNMMYKQLVDAGILQENIYSLEKYIVEHINYKNMEHPKASEEGECIVFDCTTGFLLGGVEQWSYSFALKLKERGKNVKLFTTTMEVPPPAMLKEDTISVILEDTIDENIIEHLKQLWSKLNTFKYVRLVVAHSNIFMVYSILLKICFPEKVSVVSVIHSSLDNVILENIFLQKYIDSFMCVNPSVKEELEQRMEEKEKVFFKETPIKCFKKQRQYSLEQTTPIKIGYAARLEIEDKRADLIPVLLDRLEKRKCNYLLSIAGNGTFYDELNWYIKTNNLEQKVLLLGKIPNTKIYDFWRKQDIAINVSQTEGCSLSMLESMACGCVNIVTCTRGVEWFINEGKTGYLVNMQDMDEMAEKIKYLEIHRNTLQDIGENACSFICKNCNIDEYVTFFEEKVFKRGVEGIES